MRDGLIPPPRAAYSCNRVTSKCRTPNDHLGYPSPLERALLFLEARDGSIFHRTRPSTPRCEASCRGLRGTGVIIS
jgi:hypothetical protein